MQEADVCELFATLSPDLLRFARNLESRESARDLVNDTFEVVWRKRAQAPHDPAEWRPWIFGIARNKLRQAQDRHDRDSRLNNRLRQARRCETHIMAPDIAVAAVEAQMNLDVLSRLSPDDQRLVSILGTQVFSQEELAQIFGCTVVALRTRASRMRQRIVLLVAEAEADSNYRLDDVCA